MSKQWRCFHCGYLARTPEQGREHFGANLMAEPACHIDAAKVRDMEETMRRYREEDTDLHRAIYRLQGEHSTALIREEEKGYERGLRDGMRDEWKAGELVRAIEHGDTEHRKWLHEAVHAFFNGLPIPAPRSGNPDAGAVLFSPSPAKESEKV